MTTSRYTDGIEVPSPPAVRSAWDAVKAEVLSIAISSAATTFFTIAAIYICTHGNALMAIGPGMMDVIEVIVGLGAAKRLYGKLSRLPAPKP